MATQPPQTLIQVKEVEKGAGSASSGTREEVQYWYAQAGRLGLPSSDRPDA
ncbi:hypothetical protein KSC_006720 [Ktedonobacter sp. SOSP1-52]|uniref:hypothetical protein n=1 Tax=Ktedonobacter sp. SOSP1-52 TaxID=2778366 RepID=UPI001915FBD7|nr:hypothetical protein [Ktedonobacter sp. SOSP1-52]GHO61780.1 hypothetical protein KSC_006720 [Ktedonobacter sp. SOSP1-52]